MKSLLYKSTTFKPIIHKVLWLIDFYKAYKKHPQFVPPGHFYSPLPNIKETLDNEDNLFSLKKKDIPGINLNEVEQLNLAQSFVPYYQELPFPQNKKDGLRYYFNNDYYSYSDAIFLYCMIRQFRPVNVIEIGSGFSSSAILDTNDLFFDGTISCSFIEPFPKRLFTQIKRNEKNVTIIQKKLQDVEPSFFSQLSDGDFLIIDSTHVSKIGSDVNYIFFEILPALKPGVYIHFHDIFYPFEYPKEWILSGRSWNEAYLLRTFLQFNNSFKIILFNTFLQLFNQDFFKNNMPLCIKNTGGSIWIKKT